MLSNYLIKNNLKNNKNLNNMKKTIKSLLAIAIGAFAFTACSDVPEPEGYNPRQGNGLVTYVPEGTGTATDPYNVAGVIEGTKDLPKGSSTATDIYAKGYVAEIGEFNSSFGNITFYITDNPEGKSTKFYVYRCLGLGGDKFASAEDIKLGDIVTVCGKVKNYNGTFEYDQGSYLVRLNDKTKGGGGGGEAGKGSGTETDPYDVAAVIAGGDKTNVFAKGYIVGSAYSNQETKQTEWNFGTTNAQASNILVAASATETDPTKCIAVALPSGGAVRTGLNLKDNPANLGKEVLLYGNITKYFGQPGVKETSYAKIGETEYGTKPGGGGSGGGGSEAFSVDFKANGLGQWTITDKNKPAEIAAIWKADAKYGIVATAYDSGSKTNYASESWVVSPKFNLGAVKTLTIHHAINFFTSVDVAKTQAVVAISTDGNNWTDLTLTGWPESMSWTFFDSTVDVSAYANKSNLQLAIKYISTAEKAGTWEVEKITIQ